MVVGIGIDGIWRVHGVVLPLHLPSPSYRSAQNHVFILWDQLLCGPVYSNASRVFISAAEGIALSRVYTSVH